jgi:hypothetical protein
LQKSAQLEEKLMAYACQILADSISPAGHRLTSYQVTFPRIVLAELNTHCMLERNSASSRAIPIPKRIAAVKGDPFVPEAFGRNQKGMQPGEALDGKEAEKARELWETAASDACYNAERLAALGVHKQYANRLLEPFSWHTAVITATDWDNFFHLRVNPLAQGEICKAAEMMLAARNASEPRSLNHGEWHAPYVLPNEAFDLEVRGVDVAAVSAARCARVSYLTQNGEKSIAEDLGLYARLVEGGHMSPLGHPARPMSEMELRITRTFEISINSGPALRSGGWSGPLGTGPSTGDQAHIGGGALGTITSVRGPLHYSGKLNGWISRRAHVPGEYDILGHREGVQK